MVDEVVVRGRPGEVDAAAGEWQLVLRCAGDVVQALRSGVGDLAVSGVWSGPAAEAFAGHVSGIAAGLGSVVESARSGNGLGVEGALRKAAGDLSVAQGRMPVPLVSMGDVLSARNGRVSVGWGSFAARLRGEHVDALVEGSVLAKVIDAFIRDKEQEARVVYNEVGDDYGDASRQAPSEIPDVGDRRRAAWEAKGAGSNGAAAGGIGAAPRFGAGGAPEASSLPSGGPVRSVPGLAPGGPAVGAGFGALPESGVDFSEPRGGGLAGIGSPAPGSSAVGAPATTPPGFGSGGGVGGAAVGGLAPAGLRAGRPSGRIGLGKGVSGLGADPGLRGGGSLGKPVSPALGAIPMGAGPASGANSRGMGRGPGSGAGGNGRGLSAGGMLAPMGPLGGRADPAEADRSTWLVEDEDVWGIATDVPPSVLRGDE
jgi:hypothetical protein